MSDLYRPGHAPARSSYQDDDLTNGQSRYGRGGRSMGSSLILAALMLVGTTETQLAAPADGTMRLEAGRFTTSEIGRIESGQVQIELAFVNPITRSHKCQRSGRTYLCGFYAWQSWSGLLENQEITCSVVDQETRVTRAVCELDDGTDLGLWLLQSGYAEAAPDAPQSYRSAEARSRAENIGMFSRP